jgi:hypothetical protein
MYLFSRVATLNGPVSDVMPWVAEMAAHVNSLSDSPTSVWSTVFGRALGTVSFSSIAENHAQLAARSGKLLADKKYNSLVAKASDWVTGPVEDSLRTIVSGMPTEGEPPGIGAMATLNTGVIAPGHFAAALAWSVEIASYVTSVTGTPVMFLTDQYGPFGGVAWISIAPDSAAVDAATTKLAGDAGYLSRIDAAGDFFVSGSVNASLLARVA